MSEIVDWSTEAGLSNAATSLLLELGARDLQDIQLVAGDTELLSTLPRLDQQKVKSALGRQPDELQLWLTNHSLGATVEEQLRDLGASTVADVKMIVLECEDLLDSFAKLDRFKLKKAFRGET